MLYRLAALVILTGSLSSLAVAGEFEWFIREFARQSGTQPLHIPFLGLARFSVAVVHPAGASDFHLAVFEHPNLQPDQFAHLTDAVWGLDWKPIVRVRERNGEVTNIYVQETERHLRVLITSLDHEDATFVQLRIKPQELMKFVDEQHLARHKCM